VIKINDQFSIKRDTSGWTLYHTYETTNKKSETVLATRKSYYPCLHYVVDEIFDRAPMGCNDLKEVHRRMEMIKGDVFRVVMGGS
jgi:hypothetical protein